MKVLLFAPTTATGGIRTWADEFVERFDGHVRVIDTSRHYLSLESRHRMKSRFQGLTVGYARYRQAVREIRRDRPDVVYVTVAPSVGYWVRDLPMILALSRAGIPIVVHMHGGDVRVFCGGRLTGPLVGMVLRKAALVIAITREVEERLSSVLDRGRVRYVPNMIDVGSWLPSPGDGRSHGALRVLHVGRQGRQKGSLKLLEALALEPRAEARLVGGLVDEDRQTLTRGIDMVKPQGRVALVGQLHGGALKSQYGWSDVLVLPTEAEGFPMVLLEAMASGRAIVATDVGNIAEMLQADSAESCGILLPQDCTVEELCAAIARLADDRELCRSLGRNGRQRVERFYSVDRVMRDLSALLGEARA